MKLKKGFILHDVGEEHMVVATGEAGKHFNGIIRNNSTANDIYRLLLEETSEEKIVEEMLKKYQVSREIVSKDVHRVIEQIREAGFLDE